MPLDWRTGSGDRFADRRLDYARDLLVAGEAVAAADLAAQAIEIAADWPPAWFLLGEAEEAAGRASEARTAFRRSLQLDPSDQLGAGLRLARLTGDVPAGMAPAFVSALFDQYAGDFDDALTVRLGYRGPALLADAIARACTSLERPHRFSIALDLGCGTGLAGAAMRSAVGRLEGVDLSSEMVRLAQGKAIYDALRIGDAVADLAGQVETFDLLLAADLFVYLGDLHPIVSAASRALVPGGLLAFTVESCDDGRPFALGEKLRFAHSQAHLRDAAASAYLQPVLVEHCSTRREAGVPVPGLTAVFAKP